MIQALETTYKGTRFRSRLEARWAVFFDALGIKWEYEPQGYLTSQGPYLPDFWFPQTHMFGEVKPYWPDNTALQMAKELPYRCIILDGPPSDIGYFCWDVSTKRLVESLADELSPDDGYECQHFADGHNYPEYEHRFFENCGGCECPGEFGPPTIRCLMDFAEEESDAPGWEAVCLSRSERFGS
jgi:hypothetical protein